MFRNARRQRRNTSERSSFGDKSKITKPTHTQEKESAKFNAGIGARGGFRGTRARARGNYNDDDHKGRIEACNIVASPGRIRTRRMDGRTSERASDRRKHSGKQRWGQAVTLASTLATPPPFLAPRLVPRRAYSVLPVMVWQCQPRVTKILRTARRRGAQQPRAQHVGASRRLVPSRRAERYAIVQPCVCVCVCLPDDYAVAIDRGPFKLRERGLKVARETSRESRGGDSENMDNVRLHRIDIIRGI